MQLLDDKMHSYRRCTLCHLHTVAAPLNAEHSIGPLMLKHKKGDALPTSVVAAFKSADASDVHAKATSSMEKATKKSSTLCDHSPANGIYMKANLRPLGMRRTTLWSTSQRKARIQFMSALAALRGHMGTKLVERSKAVSKFIEVQINQNTCLTLDQLQSFFTLLAGCPNDVRVCMQHHVCNHDNIRTIQASKPFCRVMLQQN